MSQSQFPMAPKTIRMNEERHSQFTTFNNVYGSKLEDGIHRILTNFFYDSHYNFNSTINKNQSRKCIRGYVEWTVLKQHYNFFKNKCEPQLKKCACITPIGVVYMHVEIQQMNQLSPFSNRADLQGKQL